MNTRTRKRRRKPTGHMNRIQRLSFPQIPCSMCGELIKDICAALSKKGEPVHFDCAIQDAARQMDVKQGEKTIYLGAGTMAAVEEKLYFREKLKIIRSIEWEPRDSPKPVWRGEIARKII